MIDCTFVTCRAVAELDLDDRVVLDSLRARGISTAVAVWDDAEVDWSSTRLCVLRSTWDYHLRYREFIAWIDRVDTLTCLRNTAELVRWNSDKFYLDDLARHAVATVPSVRIRRGTPASLADIAKGRDWRDVVVKPSQGAAAHGVLLARDARNAAAGAQSHLDSLLQAQDVLVQPYLRSVETYGERALVFFDGAYSHAVRKKPFDTELVVDGAMVRADAGDDELAIAARALAVLPAVPLYARVDLLRGDDGEVLISELELVEPSLYVRAHAPARATFARAIMRELQTLRARA